MKTFGLTGGIGMGKSAAAQILREHDVPVVDTDLIARQIVQPGSPILKKIQLEFGNQIVEVDGQLRRDELAKIIFADVTARKKLEVIMHPPIRKLWLAQIEQWRGEQKPHAVVVIPLLFETGAEKNFDSTVCVACSAVTQRQRLLERGWTSGQIEQRVAAQWSIEEKIATANFLVWTEGGLDVLEEQLKRIFHFG
ncbi:MAG: dephospho-CoA kinase [Verrucomicrobiota bacterium]|jgi:dephospho-CoA kinase